MASTLMRAKYFSPPWEDDLSRDRIAGPQAEPLDLGRAHVDVVGARQLVVFGCTEEPELVLKDLQHALGENETIGLGLGLENLEIDSCL